MPLPTPKALAATYNPPSYPDPWNAVQDYHTVTEYAAAHPEKASTAIASALDLPRSRIRPWLDGSIPDVVRGIQTAKANGWLADHATPATERALVQLAAWALSGGSLTVNTDGAHVYFTLNHNHDSKFATIAAAAGVDYTIVNKQTSERATEARPTTDGSILARVLAAMGVPEATEKHSLTALPAFVDDLNTDLREDFAKIVVANRGAKHHDKDTLTLRIKRPDPYLNALRSLLESVTSNPVTYSDIRL